MEQTKWFERKFLPIEDNGLLPNIIERLAGTPARLNYKIDHMNMARILDPSAGWSIKKEIGHLIDLEPLWLDRAKEIVANTPVLKTADLTNRKTEEADHDERDTLSLINEFTEERKKLVDLLKSLPDTALNFTSKHPRLGTPMRMIDLAYFVAEHDDHHLVKIG